MKGETEEERIGIISSNVAISSVPLLWTSFKLFL